MAITEIKRNPTELCYGEVIFVDRKASTCDVRTLGLSSSTLRRVPYCTPYSSPYGGGVDFIPEIGAQCLVATSLSSPASKEDNQNLIISFRSSMDREGGFSAEDRPEMGEGDVFISSGALNRVELRADGVTRVLAHDACVTEYTPDDGKIEHLCSNYAVTTQSGALTWGGSSGGPAALSLRVKGQQSEELGDGDVLSADIDSAGLRVAVYGDGADPLGGTGNANLSIDTDGRTAISTRSSVSVTSDDAIRVAASSVEISALGSIVLRVGDTRVEITEAGVLVRAQRVSFISDDLSVSSQTGEPQSLLKCAREEAADTDNKQLVTEDILPWIFNHVHAANGAPPLGSTVISLEEEGAPSTPASLASAQGAQRAEAAGQDDLAAFITTLIAALEAVPTVPQTGATLATILTGLLVGVESTARARMANSLNNVGVVGQYADVLTQQTKVR